MCGAREIVRVRAYGVLVKEHSFHYTKYSGIKMTYVKSWEEFEKAAERLYLQDPMKVRYSMKYTHNKGCLSLKLTDDVDCLQYKTEIVQDLKKVEKFINNLMRHMASKEQ